jgi:predicted transcriptional regulator
VSLELTHKYRILLHLKKSLPFMDSFVVPESFTQSGIASNVGITRPHATLNLQRLERLGLVARSTRHVRGQKRVMYVYFPTTQGYRAIVNLESSFGSEFFR